MAGASTSASVTYLMPVVATLVGVLILGEHLIWNQPLGALIVLTGVAISQGVLSRRARAPAFRRIPPPCPPTPRPRPADRPAR